MERPHSGAASGIGVRRRIVLGTVGKRHSLQAELISKQVPRRLANPTNRESREGVRIQMRWIIIDQPCFDGQPHGLAPRTARLMSVPYQKPTSRRSARAPCRERLQSLDVLVAGSSRRRPMSSIPCHAIARRIHTPIRSPTVLSFDRAQRADAPTRSQRSRYSLRLSARLGSINFRIAALPIWRIRSRVTSDCLPSSSSEYSHGVSSRKRMRKTSASRGDNPPSASSIAARMLARTAPSTGLLDVGESWP